MNLRSGKTLLPMPLVANARLEKMKALHDSVFEKYVCFGNTWPSLEEARDMSISTDNPDRFHEFGLRLVDLSYDKVNRVRTNRLCFLAITESLFRCGQPVLEKYFKLIVCTYQKLRDAFPIDETPRDMKQYLAKLKDLMFRVANEEQLLIIKNLTGLEC